MTYRDVVKQSMSEDNAPQASIDNVCRTIECLCPGMLATEIPEERAQTMIKDIQRMVRLMQVNPVAERIIVEGVEEMSSKIQQRN